METFLLFIMTLTVLLGLSAFFSCAETAFFSLTRGEIRNLRNNSGVGARKLVVLLRRPRETLIGILLGNELINNAIAVVAAQAVSLFITDAWIASCVAVVGVTPLVLIFGEMIPKNMAVNLASRISPGLAIPMNMFMWWTRPIRLLLTRLADFAITVFGGDPSTVMSMIMEEEFRAMVAMGEKDGALSASERDLIHGVFSFSDMTVKEVMTPKGEMFRVNIAWSLEKIVEEIRAAQYSRVPVYQDHPDDIVGLIYIRDVVTLMRRKERGLAGDFEEIIRPVPYVSPDTGVEEMLRTFQRTKVHISIVSDEQGQILGLVTMDDLLDVLIETSMVDSHDSEKGQLNVV